MSRKTCKSIIEPVENMYEVCSFIGDIKPIIKHLVLRYCPTVPTIPLFQGMSWDPTWKSLPTHHMTVRIFTERMKVHRRYSPRLIRSCFISLSYELASFLFLMNFVHSQGEQFSQGFLWRDRIRYAFDNQNKLFTPWFEKRIGPTPLIS